MRNTVTQSERKAALIGGGRFAASCPSILFRASYKVGHLSPTYVIIISMKMAGPFAKGFSTAYKRARSQDSPTPLPSPPVLKATKIEEEKTDSEDEIPAFLRQKPSGKFALSLVQQANMHNAAPS